jgi:hypothetical protein
VASARAGCRISDLDRDCGRRGDRLTVRHAPATINLPPEALLDVNAARAA